MKVKNTYYREIKLEREYHGGRELIMWGRAAIRVYGSFNREKLGF